ncbi:endonuclease/exonuclease/phosphatase family protein [Rubrivirga sp.]|uniref:endonuclease/exonuclease/phosphatase family protein n=1 Tax=Rubrivirga sp. TaxID=1885344 RepID=UPI003B526B17
MTDDTPPRRRLSVGWVLLALVEAPVLAAVVTGLAAPYLPPRPYWWAQLVAIGLPYAALALAVFAVVWLVGRRWRAVALHAVLLLIVGVRAGGPGRLAAPADGPDDLVLTTFNVPETGPSREALGDSVVAYVGATEPDLLLMQDARVIARSEQRRRAGEVVQVEAVRTRLPYRLRLPARLASHPGWQVNSTDVPFFVREGSGVEVVEQEVLILGVERDPDVSLALRSHLRWDGRDVVVYNVHLRSFGSPKPWQDPDVRLASPRTWAPYLRRYRGVYAQRGDEAAEIADRIADETLPVVVAGDFNSTADNWSYRRLRTAGGVDRADAVQAAGGRAWGRTYHASRPFVRIDFVLVDPALEVTSARTTPVEFSDHRPVRVGLRWREESE